MNVSPAPVESTGFPQKTAGTISPVDLIRQPRAPSVVTTSHETSPSEDSSNSFFSAGKQAKKDDAEDGDEIRNDVSKIVCSGNVVYRRQADGQEQVVLARKADYDAENEIIVMSGAHTAPQGEVSGETFAEIKRALSEKTTASGASVFEQYSILMQGDNWIAGNPITIHPKEGNRLKATDMKAALRRSSRSKTAGGEGK